MNLIRTLLINAMNLKCFLYRFSIHKLTFYYMNSNTVDIYSEYVKYNSVADNNCKNANIILKKIKDFFSDLKKNLEILHCKAL